MADTTEEGLKRVHVTLEDKPLAPREGWGYIRGEGTRPDAVATLGQAEAGKIEKGTVITVHARNGRDKEETVESVRSRTSTDGDKVRVQVELAETTNTKTWGWSYTKVGKGYGASMRDTVEGAPKGKLVGVTIDVTSKSGEVTPRVIEKVAEDKTGGGYRFLKVALKEDAGGDDED